MKHDLSPDLTGTPHNVQSDVIITSHVQSYSVSFNHYDLYSIYYYNDTFSEVSLTYLNGQVCSSTSISVMFQTIDFAGTIIFRLKENIAWWGKLQTRNTFGFTQLIYDLVFQIIWKLCLELCSVYSGGNKYYCCSTSCWSEQGGWEIPLTPIWSVFCISEIIHIWIYKYSIPNYNIFCCRIRDNTFHSHTTSQHSTQNWTVSMESFVCGLSLTRRAMRRVHTSYGTSSCLITLSPSQT